MATNAEGAVGFIGLGVMGEPMCRNLVLKSGRDVYGFDKNSDPLARLADDGVKPAASAADIAARCSAIILSLPSGEQVAAVCEGDGGLLAKARRGQTVIDMSTSPVDLTRRLGAAFMERGVRFADAPVARTRAAAENGTLAITVGADDETFAAIQPLLACCGTDITHCGAIGSGQVVKLLNNMVMMETGVAISEALEIGRRAGLDGNLLFEALSKGSADSFALRNHGMKAMLPGEFPQRAFSAIYARKDLTYALVLAQQVGIDAGGAQYVNHLLEQTIAAGDGELYWPVISRQVALGGERCD